MTLEEQLEEVIYKQNVLQRHICVVEFSLGIVIEDIMLSIHVQLHENVRTHHNTNVADLGAYREVHCKSKQREPELIHSHQEFHICRLHLHLE